MAEEKHKPKIVRAAGAEASKDAPLFVADEASKKKAGSKRLLSLLLFLGAIGAEVWGIFILKSWATQPNMPMLIGLIVAALILALCGSLLWKSANRLDPASKKDAVKFFVQNQLGFIIAVIAFLPLLILIFMNKDMDRNQKALAGGIGVVAALVASFFGLSLNPPSVEQYSEQIAEVKGLTGRDYVYWTKSGGKYHVYSDCQAINTNRTEQIVEGSVAQARELKNITELCAFCRKRAEVAKTNVAAPEATPSVEEPASTPAPEMPMPSPAATAPMPQSTPQATVPAA